MKSSFIIIVTVVGLYPVTATNHWSYWGEHGPAHWPGLCTMGQKQSPINIDTRSAKKADLGALQFIRYNYAFTGKIVNNGHTVQIQLYGDPIHLRGANLPATYTLEQMHFHWSAEHTINDNRDVLELHLVHYNNHYRNVSMASQYKNGVAVVATLFKLSNEDNSDIVPILKATKSVSKGVGKTAELMESRVIPSHLLPKDRAYYHYSGSLTTPGCQESVMWFVFAKRLWISEPQLDVFKNVELNSGSLSFNYRPIQPLEGRQVYHFGGHSAGTRVNCNSFSLACLSLLLGL